MKVCKIFKKTFDQLALLPCCLVEVLVHAYTFQPITQKANGKTFSAFHLKNELSFNTTTDTQSDVNWVFHCDILAQVLVAKVGLESGHRHHEFAFHSNCTRLDVAGKKYKFEILFPSFPSGQKVWKKFSA